MNKNKQACCCREEAGRYLLNRMSEAEETLFQEHLEKCDSCRSYIDSVRTLSRFTGDGELHIFDTADRKIRTVTVGTARRFSLSSIVSIAAMALLVVGVSIYLLVEGDGTDSHDTYINTRQSKADMQEMPVEIIFPERDTLLVGPFDNIPTFKWSREAAYRIIIAHEGKTVVDTSGLGETYTPKAKDIKGYSNLDWTLKIEGKNETERREWKGKIFFME